MAIPSLAYAPNIAGQVGRLFNGIGWFNFTSIPSVFTPLTVTLANSFKGGGTIQARFTLTRVNGGAAANFRAQNPPTWTEATEKLLFFSGLINNLYKIEPIKLFYNFIGSILIDLYETIRVFTLIVLLFFLNLLHTSQQPLASPCQSDLRMMQFHTHVYV